MKTVINITLAVSIAAMTGCGGDPKKSDAEGPRITSGKVDGSVKPQRPSLGGRVGGG